MALAAQNVDVLNNPDNVKMLGNILKTNVAACSSIGAPFITQIGRIYMDLLGVYKAVSELISQSVATQGPIATKTPRVRGMRTIKKEVLKLIDTYVARADDLNAVKENMVPPLLDAVLVDYNRNVDLAKDAEVLNVMANIVARLGVFA
jgi:exportin-1